MYRTALTVWEGSCCCLLFQLSWFISKRVTDAFPSIWLFFSAILTTSIMFSVIQLVGCDLCKFLILEMTASLESVLALLLSRDSCLKY